MEDKIFVYSTSIILLVIFGFGLFIYNYEKILAAGEKYISNKSKYIKIKNHYSTLVPACIKDNSMRSLTPKSVMKRLNYAKMYYMLIISNYFLRVHCKLSIVSRKQFIGSVLVSTVLVLFIVLMALENVNEQIGSMIGICSVLAVFMVFAIENWKNFGFYVSNSPITLEYKNDGREVYTFSLKNDKQSMVNVKQVWIENIIGNVKFRTPISIPKESFFVPPLSIVSIKSEISFYSWRNKIVDIMPSFFFNANVMISDGTYVYNCTQHSMSFYNVHDFLQKESDFLSHSNMHNEVLYGNQVVYAVDCIIDNKYEIGFITEDGVFYCDELKYMRYHFRISRSEDFDITRMKIEDIEYTIQTEYPEITSILVTSINRLTPNQSITLEEIAAQIQRENA